MPKKFVVIGGMGEVSSDGNDPESFASRTSADKRACAYAENEPGETIGIYMLVATCTAPVGKTVIREEDQK